jgi:hypothetical protein
MCFRVVREEGMADDGLSAIAGDEKPSRGRLAILKRGGNRVRAV